MNDRLFTRREASEYLSTTERSIDRMTAAGKLEVTYINGHSKRFRQSALDALLSPASTRPRPTFGRALPTADARELPVTILRPVRA